MTTIAAVLREKHISPTTLTQLGPNKLCCDFEN